MKNYLRNLQSGVAFCLCLVAVCKRIYGLRQTQNAQLVVVFLGWLIEVVFFWGMDEGSVVNEEMERQRWMVYYSGMEEKKPLIQPQRQGKIPCQPHLL